MDRTRGQKLDRQHAKRLCGFTDFRDEAEREKYAQVVTAVLERTNRFDTLRFSSLSRRSVRIAISEFARFRFCLRRDSGLTRTEPEQLQKSLLHWFDHSEFVADLLALGRKRKPEIEEAFEVIVRSYENGAVSASDSAKVQHLSIPPGYVVKDSGDIYLGQLVTAMNDAKDRATVLLMASSIYEEADEAELSQQLADDSGLLDQEADRLKLVLESGERTMGRKLQPKGAGMKGRWLTPVLADLDEILGDVKRRYHLLAKLVNEIEKLSTCSTQNVRARLHDYNKRLKAKGTR